ncbi:hypothetical protein ACQPZ2_39795 [Nocardia pseudovaccinii]|uniref:hypothetical protein n=1 Tax=Nocardia pseudovaccinii TaxID=189540 RepID=UPI003D8C743F
MVGRGKLVAGSVFQTLFRAVRERIAGADTDQAARHKDSKDNLPQHAPATPKIFSWPGL